MTVEQNTRTDTGIINNGTTMSRMSGYPKIKIKETNKRIVNYTMNMYSEELPTLSKPLFNISY